MDILKCMNKLYLHVKPCEQWAMKTMDHVNNGLIVNIWINTHENTMEKKFLISSKRNYKREL